MHFIKNQNNFTFPYVGFIFSQAFSSWHRLQQLQAYILPSQQIQEKEGCFSLSLNSSLITDAIGLDPPPILGPLMVPELLWCQGQSPTHSVTNVERVPPPGEMEVLLVEKGVDPGQQQTFTAYRTNKNTQSQSPDC